MRETPLLTPTQEDYLEIIFFLTEKYKVARNKDIAEKLGVRRATVTGALKWLADKELINYESHSYVTLTDQGEGIARQIVEKHRILTYFFNSILGLEQTASEDAACRIEHFINEDALSRFKNLIKSVENCSSAEKCLGKQK